MESETVKARSPLASASRPAIAELEASSASGGSRLAQGQLRRSAYAEPEEGTEADDISAHGIAQHALLDESETARQDGPDADSMQRNRHLGELALKVSQIWQAMQWCSGGLRSIYELSVSSQTMACSVHMESDACLTMHTLSEPCLARTDKNMEQTAAAQ